MKIERFVVGMIETNAYILHDENTLEAIIIDPGDEAKRLMQYIEKNNLITTEIILTHHHYDHIGAAQDLKKKYTCSISIHKKDVQGLKDPNINHSAKGFRKSISITPDRVLLDGDIINVGKIQLKVIHTPGHTEGGICLKVENEDIIFTGDTIFCDDIGRWDLEGGSKEKMISTIKHKISNWEDNMMIYPGHGECANMDYVRRKNVEFLDIVKKKHK